MRLSVLATLALLSLLPTISTTPTTNQSQPPTDHASSLPTTIPSSHLALRQATTRTSNHPTSTNALDAIAWAGIDDAIQSSHHHEPKILPRHSYTLIRGRSAGPPLPPAPRPQIVRDEDEDELARQVGNSEPKCVQCGKEDDAIICIGSMYYGFCDEGCAVPRKVMDGTRCVDGRIRDVEWM